MRSYYFDSEGRLTDIIEHHKKVKEIYESFSYSPKDYRIVAELLEIEYDSMNRMIKEFEHALLINCFTFVEQLIKKLYYNLLQSEEKSYSEKFITKKIPPDQFSPNINFRKLKNGLKGDLGIILSSFPNKNKYNALVEARHRYAHGNNYNFDFSVFQEVIDFIFLLNYRVNYYLDKNTNMIIFFEQKIPKLLKEIENLIKLDEKFQIGDKYYKNIYRNKRNKEFKRIIRLTIVYLIKIRRMFIKFDLSTYDYKDKISFFVKGLIEYKLNESSCEEILKKIEKALGLSLGDKEWFV